MTQLHLAMALLVVGMLVVAGALLHLRKNRPARGTSSGTPVAARLSLRWMYVGAALSAVAALVAFTA